MRQSDTSFAGETWSVLGFGGVELGLDYGVGTAAQTARPSRQAALALLDEAFGAGVNLIDTAPGYGESEAVIGEALRRWPGVRVATKVELAPQLQGEARRTAVLASIEGSRRRLGRERLDILQLHNATPEDLSDNALFDVLHEAVERGWVDHLGASTYGTEAAAMAVAHPALTVIQCAYNLLDQRLADPLREAQGIGKLVLLRSALLKGVLSERRQALPESLAELATAAAAAEGWAQARGMSLSEAALRFCFESQPAAITLVGLRDADELQAALAAAVATPCDWSEAAALALDSPSLVDPRYWGV